MQAMVVATDSSEAFPVPDGATRQYLSEFGDFPVVLVNRDMQLRGTSTQELYPFKPAARAGRRRARRTHSPEKELHSRRVDEEVIRIYR